jgi:hypothetical protein
MSCVRTTDALVVSVPHHDQERSSLDPLLSIDAGAGRAVLSDALILRQVQAERQVEGLRTSEYTQPSNAPY